MTICDSTISTYHVRLRLAGAILGLALGLSYIASIQAGDILVPNPSFESPLVPPVVPYADTNVDYWQKSSQPVWYDPSQNSGAPWDSLVGQFFNVPFPGLFIDNCDGNQAAFLFAVPEVALFQDYDSVYGTNTTPSHAFNAKFNAGSSYDLAVALIGGGGGMKPGATLMLSLYYRDASSNMVVVASTTVTNSSDLFPTNTHFVDFSVHVPVVGNGDPWTGQHIGVQLLSTTGFDLAGGYWDLDNIRLTETPAPLVSLRELGLSQNQISFTALSQPGVRFEVQASTSISAPSAAWTTIGTFTNFEGATVFTDSTTNSSRRYYRTRQL